MIILSSNLVGELRMTTSSKYAASQNVSSDQNLWNDCYCLLTTDGYFHVLLSTKKHELPQRSYLLQV